MKEELALLKSTINLCNPVTFHHVNDWKTTVQDVEDRMKKENDMASEFPNEFVLTKERHSGCRSNHTSPAPAQKVCRPKAGNSQKSCNLDGILSGIPTVQNPASSTYAEEFAYSDEMENMSKHKNMEYFRKKDAHSEYVEARARFSKMHSVT